MIQINNQNLNREDFRVLIDLINKYGLENVKKELENVFDSLTGKNPIQQNAPNVIHVGMNPQNLPNLMNPYAGISARRAIPEPVMSSCGSSVGKFVAHFGQKAPSELNRIFDQYMSF